MCMHIMLQGHANLITDPDHAILVECINDDHYLMMIIAQMFLRKWQLVNEIQVQFFLCELLIL